MVVFRIEGMDCADCATKLEDMVGALNTVADAKVNFGAGLLTVQHHGDPDLLRQVRRRVAEAGYHARLADEVESAEAAAAAAEAEESWWRRFLPSGRREQRTFASAIALLVGVILIAAGAPEVLSTAVLAVSIVIGGCPSHAPAGPLCAPPAAST